MFSLMNEPDWVKISVKPFYGLPCPASSLQKKTTLYLDFFFFFRNTLAVTQPSVTVTAHLKDLNLWLLTLVSWGFVEGQHYGMECIAGYVHSLVSGKGELRFQYSLKTYL